MVVKQLAVVVIGLAGVAAAFGIAMRWWDRAGLAPIVQSLFPLFGVLAVLVFLAALALGLGTHAGRRPMLALIPLAVLAGIPLTLAVPTLRSHTVPARQDDETIMISNMEFGAASATNIVQAVRAHRVQTLVLVEVTPDGLRRLDEAGLRSLLPQRVGATRTDFRGTLIASAHPLQERSAPVPEGSASMPAAQVQTGSGSYLLRGVHTYAPLPDLAAKWRAGLADLSGWSARQPGGQPLVLAGDFNSSSAMPAFRQATKGLVDAQRATGSGWVRTWPNGKSVPPFVALDHVLVKGFDVVASGSVEIQDTDHRAVWARVHLR